MKAIISYQEERLEQLETLISQYQHLLFIEEQKLLNADSDKVRGNLEKQIQYFQEKSGRISFKNKPWKNLFYPPRIPRPCPRVLC
ncbi:MAG: hypothetical protein HC913_15700 [Microscillaceae bacterium]|nr:hypothetical protein [Microscillaceae bacterium]